MCIVHNILKSTFISAPQVPLENFKKHCGFPKIALFPDFKEMCSWGKKKWELRNNNNRGDAVQSQTNVLPVERR